jgi:hypothetical protein
METNGTYDHYDNEQLAKLTHELVDKQDKALNKAADYAATAGQYIAVAHKRLIAEDRGAWTAWLKSAGLSKGKAHRLMLMAGQGSETYRDTDAKRKRDARKVSGLLTYLDPLKTTAELEDLREELETSHDRELLLHRKNRQLSGQLLALKKAQHQVGTGGENVPVGLNKPALFLAGPATSSTNRPDVRTILERLVGGELSVDEAEEMINDSFAFSTAAAA